jgi:hypothetical protein
MWERARGLRPLILGLGLLGLLVGRFASAEAPNAMACVRLWPQTTVEAVASGEVDATRSGTNGASAPAAKQPRLTDGG